MFFVLLNMYLTKHCMLFTYGGNKEYYIITAAIYNENATVTVDNTDEDYCQKHLAVLPYYFPSDFALHIFI